MFNEMPTTPVHPSYFLAEEKQKKEGGQNQNDTLYSLTNLDQTSPPKKKNRKDDSHNEKAKNQLFGCKLRVLFGYDNGKPCATITSSKEEIDSQFWYPRRNRVIKEYKNIKDKHSSDGEDDSEMVDEETTVNSRSPKIYDLRTPSKGTNYTEIALSSESSTKSDTAKGFEKTDKIPITSNLDTTSTIQKQRLHKVVNLLWWINCLWSISVLKLVSRTATRHFNNIWTSTIVICDAEK